MRLSRRFLLLIIAGLLLWSGEPPAPLHAAPATQAPTCTLTLTAPVPQYVLPSVNAGSYGTTAPGVNALTALGTDPSRAWYAVLFDADSTPPTYAWVLGQDVNAIAPDCAAIPVLDPNDVTGSLARAANPPTTTPDASPTPQPSPTPESICSISAVFANIRAEPSTEADIVGELGNGVVEAIGRTENNDWYEVQLPDRRGWVAARASSAEGECDALPITGSNTLEFSECPANFVGYREPRLAVGEIGRVPPGNQANRVRAVPQLSGAILFQLQPGAEFTVIAGPQCGDGIVWWNIQQGARTGWTAESDVEIITYFLEPVERDTSADNALQCDPADADYRPTRLLQSDQTATITDDIPSLILFTEPNLNSATILEIPGGVSLDSINVGPRCTQNAVWWNVTYNTLSGWVVESSTNDPNIEYYLLPPERTPGTTAPPTSESEDDTPPSSATAAAADTNTGQAAATFDDDRPCIDPFNARDLTQQTTLSYSPVVSPFLLWGAEAQFIVLNTAQGVQLFDYPTLEPRRAITDAIAAAQPDPTETPATAADLDANGERLVIGYQNGALLLVDLMTGQVTPLAASYAAPVSVVDISRDDERLLTASGAVYDIPPAGVMFAARVHDFSGLDTTTGEMPLVLELEFPVNEPILAGALSLNNQPVVALFDRVRILGTEGVVQETRRAEVLEGIFVQPTTNNWAGNGSSVLFGSGPAVAVYDTRTGQVVPRPVVLTDGGQVQHLAQAPTDPGADPVIAAFVNYDTASEGISGVYFISQADNSGRVAGFLAVTTVAGLAFSPDGSALAILRDASVEFWVLPREG